MARPCAYARARGYALHVHAWFISALASCITAMLLPVRVPSFLFPPLASPTAVRERLQAGGPGGRRQPRRPARRRLAHALRLPRPRVSLLPCRPLPQGATVVVAAAVAATGRSCSRAVVSRPFSGHIINHLPRDQPHSEKALQSCRTAALRAPQALPAAIAHLIARARAGELTRRAPVLDAAAVAAAVPSPSFIYSAAQEPHPVCSRCVCIISECPSQRIPSHPRHRRRDARPNAPTGVVILRPSRVESIALCAATRRDETRRDETTRR